jgi:outer membrane protein OmpA-like peptidoglycan-associated protein
MKFMLRSSLALIVTLAPVAYMSVAHAQDYPLQHAFDMRMVTATHPINHAGAYAAAAQVPVVVEPSVYFKTGSHKLTPEGEMEVAKVAKAIKAPSFKNCHLTVKGYTDSKGSDAANLKLSHDRAVTVMTALITHYGVSAESLSAEGLGKENPVADNSTPAGRALNRRVTVFSSGPM